jgi:hypothetical protein
MALCPPRRNKGSIRPAVVAADVTPGPFAVDGLGRFYHFARAANTFHPVHHPIQATVKPGPDTSVREKSMNHRQGTKDAKKTKTLHEKFLSQYLLTLGKTILY